LQIQVYVPPERAATASGKVFWFFSSEKNFFLLLFHHLHLRQIPRHLIRHLP
jgi:hypothetical protein